MIDFEACYDATWLITKAISNGCPVWVIHYLTAPPRKKYHSIPPQLSRSLGKKIVMQWRKRMHEWYTT